LPLVLKFKIGIYFQQYFISNVMKFYRFIPKGHPLSGDANLPERWDRHLLHHRGPIVVESPKAGDTGTESLPKEDRRKTSKI